MAKQPPLFRIGLIKCSAPPTSKNQQKALTVTWEKSLKGPNMKQNHDAGLSVRLQTIYKIINGFTLKEAQLSVSFLVQRSVWSPIYKAIEPHVLLINSERKETPPAIITEERTWCWTSPAWPFVLCFQLPSANKTGVKERCFTVHHQRGLRGQTVNLTPSLPGGKPPCPNARPRMHVCTSSLPWVVSYLWLAQRETLKDFVLSHLISDASLAVVPPA